MVLLSSSPETLGRGTKCTWRYERRCLALALLRVLHNVYRHLLRALETRDVDVANAGAVGAARVAWELAEHDKVKGVLLIVS